MEREFTLGLVIRNSWSASGPQIVALGRIGAHIAAHAIQVSENTTASSAQIFAERCAHPVPLPGDVQGQDLALLPARTRDIGEQPQHPPAGLGQQRRMVQRLEEFPPAGHPGAVVLGEEHPGGGGMLGLLTYVPSPGWEQCEVLTLHVTGQWHGVGTALIEAVEQLAAEHGCARLWLITTNDNVDALRFYQRRGFQLAAIHLHAVDESRSKLKPEIPVTGAYGIPVRDEIELEKRS